MIVFAAASLREALDEAGREYERRTGAKVLASYAASSTLARQIESGAPADIFISADLDWMDYLAGRVKPGTRMNLLKNRLVLIAARETNPGPAIGLVVPAIDLLRSERIAIANPDHVPAGKYAKAALKHMGVWESLQDRLVRTDNVRIALSLVSRGEAPVGIVYSSDAVADKNVRVVGEFDADSHPEIVYPAAITLESTGPQAETFLRFLRSPEAQALFKKRGFIPIE